MKHKATLVVTEAKTGEIYKKETQEFFSIYNAERQVREWEDKPEFQKRELKVSTSIETLQDQIKKLCNER